MSEPTIWDAVCATLADPDVPQRIKDMLQARVAQALAYHGGPVPEDCG